MIDADATEVQVAGYIRTIEERLGINEREMRRRRGAAITLWHIGKVAEVRDRALELIARFRQRAAT